MSAPTTAEVRGAMEQAAAAEQALAKSDTAATAFCAVRTVLECIAIPLAEHRDALAAEVAQLRAALAASEARAAKAAEACEALESLVDYSSRMFHDSTMWESEEETAPRWQAWRNWAYDAIKAAKGAGR